MPILLQPTDLTSQLEQFGSVLIVSCPVCPAASMAIARKEPLFEFFKHGFKTDALEDHIRSIQADLERRGVRTDAFTIRMPHPLMCLWTARQRERLLKRAIGFEAVLVLGCHSAAMTAEEALKDTDCKVFLGMREVGLTNATIRYRPPARVELDVHALPDNPFARSKWHGAGNKQITERST
jgi:hypothetical protein